MESNPSTAKTDISNPPNVEEFWKLSRFQRKKWRRLANQHGLPAYPLFKPKVVGDDPETEAITKQTADVTLSVSDREISIGNQPSSGFESERMEDEASEQPQLTTPNLMKPEKKKVNPESQPTLEAFLLRK